jgi:hypothetical protein
LIVALCRGAVFVALLSSACTSAMFGERKPVFSQAEVNRALAPLSQIEQRCYADSPSRRERRPVELELIAYVNEHGGVHADPQGGLPHDPALLECLRNGVQGLEFPAKGEADQIHLHVDLKP